MLRSCYMDTIDVNSLFTMKTFNIDLLLAMFIKTDLENQIFCFIILGKKTFKSCGYISPNAKKNKNKTLSLR